MFASRLVTAFRRERKIRTGRVSRVGMDTVTEQVKKVLQTADQKLILMVRG